MTTLVSSVVNRALRLLLAIDAAADTPPLDFATAVIALNAMCTRWEANGMAIGWSNVTAPDDEMPSPEEAEQAIIYNLAIRLAPEYPLPAAMPGIADLAKAFLNELRRDRLVEMPLVTTCDQPASEAGGHWNIYTDSVV